MLAQPMGNTGPTRRQGDKTLRVAVVSPSGAGAGAWRAAGIDVLDVRVNRSNSAAPSRLTRRA